MKCANTRCGDEFEPRKGGGKPQKFCSRKCLHSTFARKRFSKPHRCGAAACEKTVNSQAAYCARHAVEACARRRSRPHRCGAASCETVVTTKATLCPKHYRIRNAERRARKLAATVEPFTAIQLKSRMEVVFDNKCLWCGGSYEHADHFIPLSKGGSHTLDNLVPACSFCNISKKDLLPSEFLARRERNL